MSWPYDFLLSYWCVMCCCPTGWLCVSNLRAYDLIMQYVCEGICSCVWLHWQQGCPACVSDVRVGVDVDVWLRLRDMICVITTVLINILAWVSSHISLRCEAMPIKNSWNYNPRISQTCKDIDMNYLYLYKYIWPQNIYAQIISCSYMYKASTFWNLSMSFYIRYKVKFFLKAPVD